MLIQPHLSPRIVEDIDVLFSNGVLMPITIDKEAGDSVDFETSPLMAVVHLAAKSSTTDPDQRLPAEDITIFLSHVISITRRTREVMPPTPQQQQEFKSLLHKLHKTVQ